VIVAAGVTALFAGMARWLRGVTLPGAIAGFAVTLAIYLGAGPRGFLAVVVLFALTWTATRLGYQRKAQLQTSEPKDGRTAYQVLSNLGVAAFFAAMALSGWNRTAFLLACAAALAEAAADTISSEIGQVGPETPRLITTWAPVSPGTDGGITVSGTVAGAVAAVIVTLVFIPSTELTWSTGLLPAAAGVAGMFLDSVLGAWLERRRLLTNNSVNFLSNCFAAVLCASLLVILGKN
jgi:uncharacterized protein (TIGR00297 family)